jgi:thioredoxin 1
MLLDEFKWREDILEAAEPVLVDFWADSCKPCQMMHSVIESLARDFKVCKVNVDAHRPLVERYGIDKLPVLLIFHRGQVVARHEGVTREGPLRTLLGNLARQG